MSILLAIAWVLSSLSVAAAHPAFGSSGKAALGKTSVAGITQQLTSQVAGKKRPAPRVTVTHEKSGTRIQVTIPAHGMTPQYVFYCYLTIHASQSGNVLYGQGDNYCSENAGSIDFTAMSVWKYFNQYGYQKVKDIGAGCSYGYTPSGRHDFCPSTGRYNTGPLSSGDYFLEIGATASDLFGDIISGVYDTPDFTV